MELTAQKRDILGKKVSTLRNQGLIPAELYGRGVKNQHLAIHAKAFKELFKTAGESTMINLEIDNTKIPVMIHDVSRDSVSDEVTSIDFYQVRLDEKIIVAVPLTFQGEAPAVKDLEGILVKSMHEIKIEALPTNIPHEIAVSLQNLDAIGKSIYVRDLVVPKEVTLKENPDTAVASVTERAKEEEIPQAEITVDTVKVEGEEAKAERQAKREAVGEEQGAQKAEKSGEGKK